MTGGASGIGRAVARALAKSGAGVTIFDIETPDWIDDGRTGVPIAYHAVDLADRGAIAPALKALKAGGPFDVVVHAAGVNATGNFEGIPAEALLRLLRVNAEAPMVATGAMCREGLFARGARLVFIASLSHATGYPGASVYAASKDALAGYARSIRKPLARSGISVTAVFPGPVATPHAERHAPPGADASRRMSPDRLAGLIVEAAEKRRATLYPGAGAKAARIAGWLAPGAVTHAMRRLIFDKLEGEVW